jgi:hypothetical protein
MGGLYPIAALGKTAASVFSPHTATPKIRFKRLIGMTFFMKPFS